jgi:hypothetical protein
MAVKPSLEIEVRQWAVNLAVVEKGTPAAEKYD